MSEYKVEELENELSSIKEQQQKKEVEFKQIKHHEEKLKTDLIKQKDIIKEESEKLRKASRQLFDLKAD